MARFDHIRVILAEPHSELRTSLQDNLHDFGLKNVTITGNMSRLASAVNNGEVDLVIANTALPEGDFNKYVNELRHGHHGDNPFLVVITLVGEAHSDAVHAALNSGTDHVLAKPFTAEALIAKITDLSIARKRFVVTSDYIGPDRRLQNREGTIEVPLIDVPNPLFQRADGSNNAHQLKRRIALAQLKINEQKVLRNAFQVGWLLDYVIPEIAAKSNDVLIEEPENLQRLCEVTHDICIRIRGTRYAHISEICMTLNRMANEAISAGLCDADMQLMGRMADIIGRVFDPDRDVLANEYQRQRQDPENVQDSQDEDDSEDALTAEELASTAVA